MTSSKMENPLWKKLQNDPSLLKQFNQHQQINNMLISNNSASNNETNNEMLGNVNGANSNGNQNGENSSNDSSGSNINKSNMMNEPNHNRNSSHSPSPSLHKKNGSNKNLAGSYANKQQQQQQQQNYMNNLVDHQNQQLHQLQQYLNTQSSEASHQSEQHNHQNSKHYTNQHSIPNGSKQNNNANSNGFYYEYSNPQVNNCSNNIKRSSPVKHELGYVEKLVGSYGFVKCIDRDGRLFFHYSSYQVDQQATNAVDMALKVGDLIEFEEGIDKRNGKPIAINIIKFQQNGNENNLANAQQQQLDSMNMFNLNQLLKQNGQKTDNGQFYNEGGHPNQQNYQSIMNGLQMLNIQGMKNDVPSCGQNGTLNPAVMNLFNKENIFNQNLNNMNSSLLNMVKSSPAQQANHIQGNQPINDNLGNLAKILNMNGASLNNLEAKKSTNLMGNGNEQMEGSIAIIATKRPITSQYNSRNQNYISPQLDGRITYQRSGETFYIPYSLSDVVPSSPNSTIPNYSQNLPQLKTGDRVRFFIAQALGNDVNVPAGTYYARRVELIQDFANGYMKNNNEIQMPKQLYRGIITTLKESFGKIEREDLFKETFFHFHEYRGQNPSQELRLGLNVEFELQDRYGKEIACNVKMLPDGSVTFDELSRNVFIGRIIQPLTKLSNLIHNTNLNGINLNEVSSIGKLIFDNNNGNGANPDETLTELLFSDIDRVPNSGSYTLLEGDFVQFRIANDKRKKNYNNNTQMHRQARATQITLIEEHSLVDNSVNTGEYRERGVLVKLDTAKELVPNLDTNNQANQYKYGVIKCMEQNEPVSFCLTEVINYVRFSQNNGNTVYSVKDVQLKIGDSLEFSVLKCQKDPLFKYGLQAVRVQQLPKNTVQFEVVSNELYTGCIEREPTTSTYTSDKNCGLIKIDTKNGASGPVSKTILFTGASDTEKTWQGIGDKIQFNISTCVKTKKQLAVNIKLIESSKEQGFITMLKDNYGFIELTSCSKTQRGGKNASTPRDIFFHFSSVQNSINDLDVGDEVEFKINRKTRGDQKICAESLTKLKSGTIKANNISSTVYKGRVVQQLRSHSLTSNVNIANYSQEQHQSIVDDAYYGKVVVTSSKNNNETTYEFGLCSLVDKKKCFQIGDLVSFQLGTFQDGVKKAVNIQPQQQLHQGSSRNGNNDYKRGKIDSIKGHCGFIEYAINSNNDLKKVFFHISDVTEGYTGSGKSESSSIQIGDEIEFILMHNSRSGKYSAIKIRKLNGNTTKSGSNSSQIHHSNSNGKDLNEQQDAPVSKRPEHLITKLKIGNIDASGKSLGLLRQPSKPDGKSFARNLFKRLPGSFEPIPEPEKTEILVTENKETDDNKSENNDQISEKISPLSITDLMIANEATVTD